MRRARLVAKISAAIAFPVLVVSALYASLNVSATSGPLFTNLSSLNGIFYTETYNNSLSTITLVNQSSVQSLSFPNFLPRFSIPPNYLIGIVLALFVAISLSVILNMRRQVSSTAYGFESEEELDKRRNEVADVLDKTARELRQGGEYRNTVLECYKKICEILESRSKVDGSPLTAREFEVSVSSRLKFDTPYLSQITDIFEVARYSKHEISKTDADIAVDCLTNLSSALREAANSANKS